MRRGGAAAIVALALTSPLPAVPDGFVRSIASAPAQAARPAPAPLPSPDPPQIGIVAGAFMLDRAPEQGGIAYGHLPPGAALLRLDGKPVAVAPDGMFLIGFGRDHGPVAVLEARSGDAVTRQTLHVAPRAWALQSIPSLPKGTTPTPEYLARRRVEVARIVAARGVRSAGDGWRQAFAWPASGRISGVFGSQRIYAGEPGDYHGGVDIARGTGTPVLAPADGVVVLVAEAPFTLEGNLLMVDHGMGLNSAFLHLSRIDVRVGDRVRRGQPLGAVGMTGRATGPHLHWAMTWQGERIDPQRIAGPMR